MHAIKAVSRFPCSRPPRHVRVALVQSPRVNDNQVMNRDYGRMKESLSHVYWIGGCAAAGKTTISHRLCEQFGFQRWSGDRHWIEQWQTATPERNPIAHRIGSTLRHGGSFAWFYGRTGHEIADDYISMSRAQFPDAVDELSRMSRDNPIVVDAFLGFPELISQVAKPENAVFLICTDDFMRETWKLRTTEGKPGFLPILSRQLRTCPDPQYALDNFIESNIIESRFVADDCRREAATMITTGGSIGVDAAYLAVKRHFRLDG